MSNPQTFEEAVSKIKEDILDSKEYPGILQGSAEDIAISVHSGYGRHIRNEWGLWAGSPLKDELSKMGLQHPDDMSSVLIVSAVRDLKNQPRNIEQMIAKYDTYWTEHMVKDIIT